MEMDDDDELADDEAAADDDDDNTSSSSLSVLSRVTERFLRKTLRFLLAVAVSAAAVSN